MRCNQPHGFCKVKSHGLGRFHPILISWCLPALFSLSGCMVGPDFVPPPAPEVCEYTECPLPKKTVSTDIPDGHAQKFVRGQNLEEVVCSKSYCWGRDLSAEWWRLFRSKPLNALIERGFAQNASVEAAQAALRVARENYWAGVGDLFPAVSLQAFAQRQRVPASSGDIPSVGGLAPSSLAASPGIANQGTTFSLYNVSVDVSYTLDIFGGIRRNIESLCALVNYNRYILEGTYLSLAANIATTAIQEASLRSQIQATRDLIRIQKELLKIINNQFELGAISKTEVLVQQTQMAQTEATLPPLELQLANARHALAALVGEFPADSCIPKFTLESLHLPERLPVSLPSCLVRQRPDIRAQEALMHQASALIGVATANMLPQVNLTGSYGYQGLDLSELIKPSNVFWSYGAQVFQPLFQGGTLSARRCAAIATFEQTSALYRDTVLKAFQNVADSLKAVEIDAKFLKSQWEAERSASQSLTLVETQLKLGAINYALLLDAQRQLFLARIQRIRVQAARFSDTVALFQSLGGGWWNCDR